jgi:hypothetical protein
MPGIYRVDLPNAVFASGSDKAIVMLKGAANTIPVTLEYQLTAADPNIFTEASIASTTWSNTSRTITGGTLTTNNDKTGYGLTQAFPSNFSSLSISASGKVSIIQSDLDYITSHIPEVNLYFIKYNGNEDLFLNGLGMRKNRIYLFARGSAVRLPKGKPIYFSDISARLCSILQETDFHL